jgi:hypothetical protein
MYQPVVCEAKQRQNKGMVYTDGKKIDEPSPFLYQRFSL